MARQARLAVMFVAVVLPAWVLAACVKPTAMERAQTLVRENRAGEAMTLLRDRLRDHPEDLGARRLLVRVLAVTGDLGAARVEVEELARRARPNDPIAYIELGHALELAHRYDEALGAYDDAARVAPESAEGPREGGMRCAHWGEAEAARPRLEEAVRRGARDGATWHALGLVRLHLGDLDGAAQAYRAGTVADPGSAENWLGLATVGVVRGDANEALEAYDQIVARRPRFAAAQLGRAWALEKLGREVDASRALDLAAELGAPRETVERERARLAVSRDGAALPFAADAGAR